MQYINPLLLSASILAILALTSATDYCASYLCDASDTHTACGNSDAAMVNIDASLKATLVNAHNTKRNLIAGGSDPNHDPACRMATMDWDDELASVAALNVRRCVIAHDKCRNTDAFRYSGQNLAWMGYYGAPNNAAMLSKAVDLWYSEVADSKMEHIKAYTSNYKGPVIGHFTVMVADRNIRVGCAAATYSVSGESYKAYMVACNYATTNMVNFPLYAACEKAGSSCTTGTNPVYPNLCSTSESYAVNKWF